MAATRVCTALISLQGNLHLLICPVFMLGPGLPPTNPANDRAQWECPLFGPDTGLLLCRGAPCEPGCNSSAQDPFLPFLLSQLSDQRPALKAVPAYSCVLSPLSFIAVSPVNLLHVSFYPGVCFSKDPSRQRPSGRSRKCL